MANEIENCFWRNSQCYNCSDAHDTNLKTAPAVLVSSVLSILGSLLIISTYLVWKDVRRSIPRTMVFWMSMADLMGASIYLISTSVNYGHWSNIIDPCADGEGGYGLHFVADGGLSFLQNYFNKAGYMWTLILAIYFVIVLVFRKGYLVKRWHFFIFHLICWITPLIFVVPLLVTGWLGRGTHSLAPSWYFVSDTNFLNNTVDQFPVLIWQYLVAEFSISLLWEFFVLLFVMVCYFMIFCCNRCRWRKESKNPAYATQRISVVLAKIDKKLILIPIAFLFLKSWIIFRYFVQIPCNAPVVKPGEPNCSKSTEMIGVCVTDTTCGQIYYWFPLVLLMSFCMPLQGFANSIIFVCLSDLIMRRILNVLSCGMCRKRYSTQVNEDSDADPGEQSKAAPSTPLSVNCEKQSLVSSHSLPQHPHYTTCNS